MPDQFFYHSFPRRGSNSAAEIDKGCAILASMRDLGLALIPEFLEWRQPLSDGNFRLYHKVQQRACFTELSSTELAGHCERFGHFTLEFEQQTLRDMGGVPVFYIPQPGSDAGGSQLGTYLLGIASDAQALSHRINEIHKLVHDPACTKKLSIQNEFQQGPQTGKRFIVDRDHTKLVLDMLGNAITPWSMLNYGLDYLMNMFYPADDIARDRPLDYYRQREWRIAGAFAINGQEIMRPVTRAEEPIFSAIDQEFFFRPIKRGVDEARMIDKILVMPRLGDRSFLQLVRRLIVPRIAVPRVRDIVATTAPALEVAAVEDL